MEKEILSISNLSAGVPKTGYLVDFTLHICQGELVNIIGTVTSGISALSELLQGNLPFQKGVFQFCGENAAVGKCINYNKRIICLNESSQLFDKMPVWENIVTLAQINKPGIYIRPKEARERAKQLLKDFNLDIDINVKVEVLSLFQKHVLSIVKAVEQEAVLVNMNNCFKHYSHMEAQHMCEILKVVKERNVAVLWSDLRVEIAIGTADRVMALNGGNIVRQFYQEDFDERLLQTCLYGENPEHTFEHKCQIKNEVSIKLNQISIDGISSISISAKKGEIVGLFHPDNIYNNKLAKAIVGECDMDSGTIFIDRKPYVPKDIKTAINRRIGYLPENMLGVSLCNNLSIYENLSLLLIKDTSKFKLFTNKAVINMVCKEELINPDRIDMTDKAAIEGSPLIIQVETLLSKWIVFRPKVFVCMDISSFNEKKLKNMIYEMLEHMAGEGTTIFISAARKSVLHPICDKIYSIGEYHLS